MLYSPPSTTDFSPPTFGPVSVGRVGSNVAFSVNVTDPDGASDVKRVLAIYRDSTGVWRRAEFSHTGSLWSGAGPASGDNVEWFIQAADAAGNVGVTSNKADIESLTLPLTGTISAQPSGQQTNGWYTGPATVTLTGDPGVTITYSVDGSPFQSYDTPFQVTGTGVHVVSFGGSDGSSGTIIIPIDVTPPEVIYTAPVVLFIGQTVFDFYSCADAGSGVATCSAGTIDTSTATPSGTTRSVTVTTTDFAGHTTSTSIPYTVVRGTQTITFDPIPDKTYGDPDFQVSATASSGLPVTFSAGGNCTVSASTVHITGAGSCTITASQAGNTSWSPAPDVSRTFSIAKAAVTITAKDRFKFYGETLDLGTTAFTATGLVSSDTVTGVTLTSDGAAASAPIGIYDIVPSNAVGSGLSNYNITYKNGKLTVGVAGFVGLDSVSISSATALVDSYQGPAPYSSTSAAQQAEVLSNGSITIGGAKIYGNVRSTAGGVTLTKDSLVTGNVTAGTTVSNNNGTVQGKITQNQPVPKINAPLPAACSPFSSTSGVSGGTFTYSKSTGDLSITKVRRRSPTGPTASTTFPWWWLDLEGQRAVVLNLTGILNTSGGSISNTTNNAANLKVLSSYTGSSGVSVSGGTSTYFSVYAPGTAVSISGSSHVFGAILGKSFTSSGNAKHHYDTALAACGARSSAPRRRSERQQRCVPGLTEPGVQIITSTVGNHTFTVTATDLTGNTITKTIPYTVVFRSSPSGGRSATADAQRRQGRQHDSRQMCAPGCGRQEPRRPQHVDVEHVRNDHVSDEELHRRDRGDDHTCAGQPQLRLGERSVDLHVADAEGLGRHMPPAPPHLARRLDPRCRLPVQVTARK